MRRALLALTLLAGCDRAFGLSHPDVDATLLPLCPASYTQFATGSYRIEDTVLTWAQAERGCHLDQESEPISGHTHLVVASNDTELVAVHQLAGPARIPWIGLTDDAIEGQFVWVTSEPIVPPYPPAKDAPWSVGEPNDANGGEDCVDMQFTGTINDDKCDYQKSSICECDAYEAN